MTENRESSRVKALERGHILDEATRNRRQKKALEALERDNFLDDSPSSIYVSDFRLQLNKKFQQRFALVDESNQNESNANLKENVSSGSLTSTNQTSTANNEIVNSFINEPTGTKKKKLKSESKLRFRKNFATMLEEEHSMASDKKYNYFSICVPPSNFPPRKFCAVCGFPSSYTCIQCGAKYCSTKCLQTHKDTRCLKWTA